MVFKVLVFFYVWRNPVLLITLESWTDLIIPDPKKINTKKVEVNLKPDFSDAYQSDTPNDEKLIHI